MPSDYEANNLGLLCPPTYGLMIVRPQSRKFPMKSRSVKAWRLKSSILLSGLLLWGCAGPLASVAPNRLDITTSHQEPEATPASPEEGSATDDFEVLRKVSVAQLSPDQVSGQLSMGQRIRWAGGVTRIATTDQGMCLTILYALSGEDGQPLWTNTPTHQSFEACAASGYDPALVHEHTNVTIIGRITGGTHKNLGGGRRSGPVVQIERLFRWSDCLAGDPSPVCKIGFLDPQTTS